jgi:hypothetical protein
MTDHAYDAILDEIACEDPEHRTRGLFESPSKFLTRRAASYLPPTRSAPSSPAEQPGVPAPSSVGASGVSAVQGGPGWSPDRRQ